MAALLTAGLLLLLLLFPLLLVDFLLKLFLSLQVLVVFMPRDTAAYGSEDAVMRHMTSDATCNRTRKTTDRVCRTGERQRYDGNESETHGLLLRRLRLHHMEHHRRA